MNKMLKGCFFVLCCLPTYASYVVVGFSKFTFFMMPLIGYGILFLIITKGKTVE